jgi:hypothetical protein
VIVVVVEKCHSGHFEKPLYGYISFHLDSHDPSASCKPKLGVRVLRCKFLKAREVTGRFTD